MHIKVRYIDGPSTGMNAVASYIQGCLDCLDAEYSVTLHGDTAQENADLLEHWKVSEEELRDLEE